MNGSRSKQIVGAHGSAPSQGRASEVWVGQRGAKITLSPDGKAVAAIDLLERQRGRQPIGMALNRSKLMKQALAQIAAYFSGGGVKFSFPIATDPNSFRAKVYAALRRVPAGQTLSYGDLAHAAGFPGAARAVGTSMAKNPLPLVVPCHRVVAAGGKLGGYSGGLHWKKWLLELEQGA